MALWDLEEFMPKNLLPWVRMQPTPAAFAAQRWLPNLTVDELDFEYIKGRRGQTVMAHVMGFDAEAPIASRQVGGGKVSGTLPPIKRKSRIGEREIIKFVSPRQGSTEQRQAINQVYRDTADLLDSIQARVEWLRIKSMSEPTVEYDEDGVVFEFDFGLTPELQFDLTAKSDGTGTTIADFGGDWANHETSTPITDLQWIVKQGLRLHGQRYSEFVTSSEVIAHLQASKELWLLSRGPQGIPGILTQGEIDAVFARYGLPTPVSYDVFLTREEADGSLTDFQALGAGRGFLVPVTPLGNTLWGPTAESLSLYGTPLQGQAPGIYASTFNTTEPVAEWIKAAAVSFPTMPNAHVLSQLQLTAA